MEQSGRLGRRVALIAALALAGAGAVFSLQPRREPAAGHAYAVPRPEGRVVVEVLNGTRRPGLARAATRVLRRQGIDVINVGNADTAAAATYVAVRRGDPARGRMVADALGGDSTTVIVEIDTLRRVDVSVVLGDDYRPSGELHP